MQNAEITEAYKKLIEMCEGIKKDLKKTSEELQKILECSMDNLELIKALQEEDDDVPIQTDQEEI